jgi:hypothetical protein
MFRKMVVHITVTEECHLFSALLSVHYDPQLLSPLRLLIYIHMDPAAATGLHPFSFVGLKAPRERLSMQGFQSSAV